MSKAIFIGDSICYGYGAENNFGTCQMLAEKLNREGWETEICAIPGQKTSQSILRLQRDVLDKHPDICFVRLALANEGMRTADTPEKRFKVCGTYESNMDFIVRTLQKNNIHVVLCGINLGLGYTPEQEQAIRNENEWLKHFGVPVLDWMPVMCDASGRPRADLLHDQGHPNDAGYRAMYACIPDNITELAQSV